MYPLLPWKLLGSALAAVVAIALSVDDLGALAGVNVPDRNVVRYLPPALLMGIAALFAPTGYWAPWRMIWRLVPRLNDWVFPDLNGVWVGTTGSNWPTIKKMLDAAQAHETIGEDELYSIPVQRDAMAVEMKASLFRLSLLAGLSATEASSHSITARPRRGPHTGVLRISYMYEQLTPDPALTDQDQHIGAADLEIDGDSHDSARGVYWTQRSWKKGLNTAGRVELRKVAGRREGGKSLQQYAAEERDRLKTP